LPVAILSERALSWALSPDRESKRLAAIDTTANTSLGLGLSGLEARRDG